MFFNPEMSGTYRSNIDKYTGYFSSVVRNIDIYLQEDQLMQTKCGFPLVPVPTYVPQVHKLGENTVCHIEDTANSEVRRVKQEMLNVMEGGQDDSPHDMSNASIHSSFSRLNDMGYGLNRPITFNKYALQTPNNRGQGRAPTSTPRKMGKQSSSQADQQDPPKNNTQTGKMMQIRVFQGQGTQKLMSMGKGQLANAGMQTSPNVSVPTGIMGRIQTSPKRDTQIGGTQTSPPPTPKKSTSSGGTQTTPP